MEEIALVRPERIVPLQVVVEPHSSSGGGREDRQHATTKMKNVGILVVTGCAFMLLIKMMHLSY